jgi:hypothetical protein
VRRIRGNNRQYYWHLTIVLLPGITLIKGPTTAFAICSLLFDTIEAIWMYFSFCESYISTSIGKPNVLAESISKHLHKI